MGIDFGSLIVDLETLVCSSKEDFINEFWGSYETYVNKYNGLLTDIQSLGFYKKLKLLESVPFSDQAFESGFTKQEQAKLREVANASSSLLKKVKLLLSPPASYNLNNKVRSNKIFVAHANDNEMKSDLIQTLEKLELDPIILHEKANGQSLIEQITANPQISFAVVLLSPDETKYMAKQSIIFELGYFLGKLGPENVVAIYQKKSDFEIPNDYTGVLWIEYKSGWYFKLIKQLQTCNFDVDANKLGWL